MNGMLALFLSLSCAVFVLNCSVLSIALALCSAMSVFVCCCIWEEKSASMLTLRSREWPFHRNDFLLSFHCVLLSSKLNDQLIESARNLITIEAVVDRMSSLKQRHVRAHQIDAMHNVMGKLAIRKRNTPN